MKEPTFRFRKIGSGPPFFLPFSAAGTGSMSAVMRLRRRRTMMMVMMSRRGRWRAMVHRLGVHHRCGPQNIQGGSHQIHDVRCQADSAVSMVAIVTSVMISGKGGSPDDDGGTANGDFKDRVLHFSSPVLRFSRLRPRFLTIKRFVFRIIAIKQLFFYRNFYKI